MQCALDWEKVCEFRNYATIIFLKFVADCVTLYAMIQKLCTVLVIIVTFVALLHGKQIHNGGYKVCEYCISEYYSKPILFLAITIHWGVKEFNFQPNVSWVTTIFVRFTILWWFYKKKFSYRAGTSENARRHFCRRCTN